MSKVLTKVMSNSLSYTSAPKETFHREGKKVLRALAKSMGLEAGSYDIRSNKAGIAVSGEVTLHGENIYVQLSQPCYGSGNEILYRTCNGRKDYSGNTNNFAAVSELEDINAFACRLINLIG